MRLTAIAALLCTAAQAQPPAGAPADKDLALFTQLKAQWNDGHLHGDAEALDRLWADSLRVVVPKMTPLSKTEALSFFRSGRMTFLRYETSELGVRVYGDSAVVSGRVRRSRERAGQVVQDDWAFHQGLRPYWRRLARRGVSRVRDWSIAGSNHGAAQQGDEADER